MAKPRIFVSSTYYDLRHLRAVLSTFIEGFGYEPILFEKGAIPFLHEKTLEDNCLGEVDGADILILVIGGRYGSLSKEDQDLLKSDPDKFYAAVRSVTRREYERARERDIPIFIFVEDGVLSEFKTFQENRENRSVKYAHVDDVRIYDMLDDIFNQVRNNYVKGFLNHDEILQWLRDQWAGIFAESLKRRQTEIKLANLESQIRELGNVVSSLKALSEAIVRSVEKEKSREIISEVNNQLQERQRLSFADETLIKHLLISERTRLSVAELYERFMRSRDFDAFIDSLDLDSAHSEQLSEMRQPRADFSEMKRRYSAGK